MKVEVYSSESEDSITCSPIDSKNPKPADAVHIRFIEGIDWEDCTPLTYEISSRVGFSKYPTRVKT